jgi:hypothetical protein
MKKNLTTIFNGLLFGLLFGACGQTNSDNSTSSKVAVTEKRQAIKTQEEITADSIALLKQDSLNRIFEAEQQEKLKTAIKFAEKDFFSSLKGIDRDFGENNFSKFSRILKQHRTTAYDLYLELTEMKKKAYSKAKSCCTETRANGNERILHNYFDVLKREIADGENKFKIKYGCDNRLLQCFENNYCSCLGDNSDKYCSGRQPIFPNGEFWNK